MISEAGKASIAPARARFEAAEAPSAMAGSPFGPGRLEPHAGVAALALAASLSGGPRLGLRPDAARRGHDGFLRRL
jgi:hypothetical protein